MIFLDSWVWLEYLGKSEKSDKCKELILGQEEKVISTIVIVELRYHGIKKFGLENTENIISLIEESNFLIVPISIDIAKIAADLRLKYYSSAKPLSFADTLNLATSILTGCKKFYSGDSDFKDIEEIETVII